MLLDKKILDKIVSIETAYDTLRFETALALDAEMAQTFEHFRGTPPDDARLEWKPVVPGDRWGESWSTAWFRAGIIVPAELDGLPLFLSAKTGGRESLLIVDGRHMGSFDQYHPVRLVTLSAKAGTRVEIALESYAGHTIPGVLTSETVQEVEKDACKYEGLDLVLEKKDVSAFVRELRTLRQVAAALDDNSLRKGRIQQAMQEVFVLVYAKPAEVSEAVWRDGLTAARAVMRPLLALRNGPTAPTLGIIGHSHIDTAWLWTLQETWRKIARTFSSVLSLMDQYPEFRFTQSAAYHADVARRLYPEIFERIQQRVREGRWEINGAMWVEPDCNIPSGEAFVRQCLIGQTATREMFGVTSDTLWQPDVFGYSAALPQILRSCGVRYFCTTKLDWNDTNKFPYDMFFWRGIDGTEVLAHFNIMYWPSEPEIMIRTWNEVKHKDVTDRRLLAFGWGDGGGGPTAEMIETARLTVDLEGCPKTPYQSISEFMTGAEQELQDLPRWVGELYLEFHRGTLTSIAALKRLNRKGELALRDAEMAATLAWLVADTPYPAARLGETWKTLLVNQFHDILPGSSIAEVNDRAIAEMEGCLEAARQIRDEALSAMAPEKASSSCLVVNTLSWTRDGEFELEGLPEGVQPAGDEVVVQPVIDLNGTAKLSVAGMSLPPLSAVARPLVPIREPAPHADLRFEDDTVQTPFARVRFDSAGRIVSFYDLAARRELVREGMVFNGFLMGEDVPDMYDNWDIDREQRLKLAATGALLSSELVAVGPLQLRIRHKRSLGSASDLVQDIVFHARTPRVDFETRIEWQEKYQLLKVGFALDILAETARHEIQFGHVTRSAHDNTTWDRAQFDVCAHKWTDISENGYGVAFLNDCKYGCTVKDSEYRLSLIKSGRHPDARGDEGTHRFTYSILPHAGGFRVGNTVRPAYELNIPPLVFSAASGQETPLSLASVDTENIIVEAVKKAESGDAFVLRLYEAGKTGTHVRVRFGVPVTSVQETDMLEGNPQPLPIAEGGVDLYFRPFEIKTLVCRT